MRYALAVLAAVSCGCVAPRSDGTATTIAELAARPAAYYGKHVVVRGFLLLSYEGDALASAPDSDNPDRQVVFLDYGVTRNARFRRRMNCKVPVEVRVSGTWSVKPENMRVPETTTEGSTIEIPPPLTEFLRVEMVSIVGQRPSMQSCN